MMSGQSYLPEVFAALAKSGLTFRWTLQLPPSLWARMSAFCPPYHSQMEAGSLVHQRRLRPSALDRRCHSGRREGQALSSMGTIREADGMDYRASQSTGTANRGPILWRGDYRCCGTATATNVHRSGHRSDGHCANGGAIERCGPNILCQSFILPQQYSGATRPHAFQISIASAAITETVARMTHKRPVYEGRQQDIWLCAVSDGQVHPYGSSGWFCGHGPSVVPPRPEAGIC